MSSPEPIRWTAALLTGVDEIDRQHRVLVNTINDLIEQLPYGATEQLAERITRDLLGYALYHFEMEEGLMAEYGYREYSNFDARSHLAQHAAFSDRVGDLRERMNRGVEITLEPVLVFLHDWLVNHIMNTDMRLAKFIRSRREETSAH